MSGTQVDQFKQVFIGTVAQRDTPMLAGLVTIPDTVKNSIAVKAVITSLDGEMDRVRGEAVSDRSGTQALGRTWTKDKNSTLGMVTAALNGQVDTDALDAIRQGKGQAKAQDALQKLRDADALLQQTVADELVTLADAAADDANRAVHLGTALNVVGPAGSKATGADELVEKFGSVLERKLGLAPDALPGMTVAAFKAAYLDKVVAPMKMNTSATRVANRKVVATGEPDLDSEIHELVKKITGVAIGKLTLGGNAALIHALLTASKMDDQSAVNMSRAGKFSDDTQPALDRARALGEA